MNRGSFLTLDGCRLGYVDEGTGLPVLWQHGLGASQRQPAEVFPAAPGLRRITLECRGHGGSDLGAPESLSIARFAEDAIALLDHLGVRRAVVGGISLGAAIALWLAVHHPRRVRGLIIARPAWIDDHPPERMQPYLDVAQLLARHGADEGLQRFTATERYRQLGADSPDNAASLRGLFGRDRETTVALLSRLPSMGSGVSREQMSRLALPTLVIANERDHVHPVALAHELAELIPGATLSILPPKASAGGAYVKAFRDALAGYLHEALRRLTPD